MKITKKQFFSFNWSLKQTDTHTHTKGKRKNKQTSKGNRKKKNQKRLRYLFSQVLRNVLSIHIHNASVWVCKMACVVINDKFFQKPKKKEKKMSENLINISNKSEGPFVQPPTFNFRPTTIDKNIVDDIYQLCLPLL